MKVHVGWFLVGLLFVGLVLYRASVIGPAYALLAGLLAAGIIAFSFFADSRR